MIQGELFALISPYLISEEIYAIGIYLRYQTVLGRSFGIRTLAGRKDLQIRTFYTLILQPQMEFEVCSGMSNSRRSRWKLAEQTVIRVQIVRYNKSHNTTSTTQRQETLIGTKPGHPEWPGSYPEWPHRQGGCLAC